MKLLHFIRIYLFNTQFLFDFTLNLFSLYSNLFIHFIRIYLFNTQFLFEFTLDLFSFYLNLFIQYTIFIRIHAMFN